MELQLEVALIGLAGAVVGGGISSVTALIIARSERKKFARERLWDLRREGYTRILASLVPAAQIARHMAEEFSDDPHGYHGSESLNATSGHFIEQMHNARNAFHAYRLVLSAAFAERFEAMEKALRDEATNPNLAPPEQADNTRDALVPASQALLKMASDELQSGAVDER